MRILLLFNALIHLVSPLPATQAANIIFANNVTTADFPTTITFSTTVNADSNITDIKLIYGVDQETCSEVEANAFPDVKPAKEVSASWQWDMRESGSLPPGAEIWWQWEATTQGGETAATPRQAVTWIDAVHPWEMITDGNLRLHSYQIPAAQTAELLTAATDAEKRLTDSTGMAAKNPIDIYIYPNSTEMTDAILYEPGWTGGMAFSEYNKIIMGAVLSDMEWTKRTVAHELTHILVGDYSFSCLWTTPTWLEEGLAVLGEGEPDAVTVNQFETAVKENRLLSFQILSASFSEDPSKADLSYSQSYYMVKYLTDTYGREKINLLLTTLARGMTVDEALTEVYGFDLNGFEKDWRASYHLSKRIQPAANQGGAPTPTVIPTLQPVSGTYKSVVATQPLAQPAPATLEPQVAIATAIPQASPSSQGTSLMWIYILAGGLALGLVFFFVIRSRNKKRNIISAFIIVIVTSTAIGVSVRMANGQSGNSTQYPQWPTATQYSPAKPAAGTFFDASSGIRMNIPTNAVLDSSQASANYQTQISLENDVVIGHLFSSPAGTNLSLKEFAQNLTSSQSAGMENVQILEDGEITLNDGKTGWHTVFDGTLIAQNMRMRVSLVTTRNSNRAVTLLLYSDQVGFESYLGDIEKMNASLTISEPDHNGYPRENVLLIEGGESDNPTENDPATTRSTGGDYLVFTGLVSFDPNLNLVPELAESWDVSEDGLTYTFHLQPDAMFHNRRPVTAEDVVYSWERAANPATESETVLTYLGDIQGVKEMRAGKADHISGLKILDDHTLQVTLQAPVPYFLMKLTYPTGYVVDRENIAMGRDWYRTPNGTGPYRLARWEEKKTKIYELFDGFYGNKPSASAIIVLMYQGRSTQLYEQGMIDYAGVYTSDLVRFTDPTDPLSNQLHSAVNLCTSYITMDVTKPPFDDVRVRQAFAMSVDKEKYVNVLMDGAGLAAKGLYPPALPGYSLNLKGLTYDPQKARVLLKESKYGGSELPPIVFTISGYGSDIGERTSGLVQMWEDTLRVKITIQNIEPTYYQDAIDSGKHGQLISEGWCADYPDPENFADILFHSDVDMNRSNYVNPQVNTLLEQARVEKDVTRRMDLYHQAEEIIVNDAPAVFLAHGMSHTLVQPFIGGYIQSPMGVPLERYLWVDGAKLDQTQ